MPLNPPLNPQTTRVPPRRLLRGAQLREERLSRGLSTYRIAVAAGLHPSTVRKVESGLGSDESVARIVVALASAPVERSA